MSQCFLYNQCNHKDCDKDYCNRKFRMTVLYNKSLVSEKHRTRSTLYWDNDGSDQQAFMNLHNIELDIKNFVQSGRNLFIHSANCGNGKTSWSLRLLDAYFNKIWPKTDLTCKGLFISVPMFLTSLKNSITNYNEYVEYVKANVMEADLVIWDDIAAKTGSEFEINQLLSYIEGRLTRGKANIFTSNLNRNEISANLGPRLASRICNMSTDIELKGADKRFFNIQSTNV